MDREGRRLLARASGRNGSAMSGSVSSSNPVGNPSVGGAGIWSFGRSRVPGAVRAAVALGLIGWAVAALAAPANIGLVGGKTAGEFETTAPYVLLMDAESGTVLFEKNADSLTPPSSMAKMMTAEIVFNELKQGNIKLDTEYLVSEDAWRRGGAPSHTSSMFLPIHSRASVEDLIQGAVVQSGNDACITLAEGIGGNERAFVEKMNKRARELGMEKSFFTNATGLPDAAMKVTVRELARLARHIIRTYPDYYRYFGEHEFTWNKIRQQNRNPLLAAYTGADGLKTGFTVAGGYGLTGSAVQNGVRLILVINGLKSAKERGDEAKRLLDYGFKSFEPRPLFNEGQVVGVAKLFGGASGRVSLVGQGPISVLVPKNSPGRLSAKIVYAGPVPAPITAGQQVANLNVYRDDSLVLEAPLYAGESVERGNLRQRAFDAATELVIGLIRMGTKDLLGTKKS
jgi:D-alanyl-D-alanine carboxypeptidase (penicillin-binding protein 5/6)